MYYIYAGYLVEKLTTECLGDESLNYVDNSKKILWDIHSVFHLWPEMTAAVSSKGYRSFLLWLFNDNLDILLTWVNQLR